MLFYLISPPPPPSSPRGFPRRQSKARARAMLARMAALEAAAKRCGSDFLALEKFVNLNYQALPLPLFD